MNIKIVAILVLMSQALFSGVINVALAANVSYAIDELKQVFQEENPHTKVNITLGGSGKLTAQIKHGAPFDIFMSADMAYPESLFKEGLATTKPTVYAQGTLAIFSAKEKDFSKGLGLLADENSEKIAIANPKTAPYGRATVEALKNAKLYEDLKKNFVYGESISQTLFFAVKATDIGIIAKSALFSPKLASYKQGVNWKEVDTTLYTPIKQGIVMLKKAKDDREVQAFYDFISSAKAKNIFNKFGYIVP